MINASQIQVGNLLRVDNELCKVLSYSTIGTAKSQKQVKVSMKSIPEGKVHEKVFHSHDKVEDVIPEIKKVQYSYSDKEALYLMDERTFEQISIPKDMFGKKIFFLKEGDRLTIRFFEDTPIDVGFPSRIRLKVVQSPGAIHDGSSVYKKVRLENDMEIDVPQFIKENDMIEIDTETVQYIDRVKDEGGKE